jgi:nucleoside-diphosphate-sugar epimerase
MLPRVRGGPEADVHDEAALDPAAWPARDAVVNLVAILHGSQAAFRARRTSNCRKKIARACAAAGVHRLVHISALGAALDAPSMYQRSKARGEAALDSGGTPQDFLDLTLLRPERDLWSARQIPERVRPAAAPGARSIPLAGAETRFQPVWVDDVAEAVHALPAGPRHHRPDRLTRAGRSVFTLRELVKRLAGQYAGVNQRARPPGVRHCRWPLARRAGLADGTGLPGEPLMTRDNLDSMAVDNVASGKVPGLDAQSASPPAALESDRAGLPAQTLRERNRVAREALRPHQSGRHFA